MTNILKRIIQRLIKIPITILFHLERKEYGLISNSARLIRPDECTCPKKVFLYEKTSILGGARFIISPNGESGRFIMKKGSGAAQGLTIVTGNHSTEIPIDKFMLDNIYSRNGDSDKDVVIEEDVWLGINVTILAGVTIGRGSIVGAGSVVRKSIPPYSIVFGNPARVVSFIFTPEEIIEREKILYDKNHRLDYKVLVKNYNKYYLKQLDNIAEFIK